MRRWRRPTLSNHPGSESDWVGSATDLLPGDGTGRALAGRVWDPAVGGPTVVAVRDGGVWDVAQAFPTVRDLCEQADPASALAIAKGTWLGSVEDILANSATQGRDPSSPWFLAPIDLQVIKAAGVTFAASMIERVIEERLRGDPASAAEVRDLIRAEVGPELGSLVPGSAAATALKRLLIEKDLWSQYLEVGIGPDAEIFTKAPVLSAVGTGQAVGVLEASSWNNPEPEVAVLVQSTGRIVGATLANDVNLRDIEGRSALLLPKAKDNTASCAIGPLVRFFDSSFSLDSVRGMSVRLRVDGEDDFHLDEISDMNKISRDPADLVAQLIGKQHQYPDGAILLLGTMFAPVADRGEPGQGFTHARGDVVRISSVELGTLVNVVLTSEECPQWDYGLASLMRNLAHRELL
jgi:fumarylacetoacetate (FAA) hydrolase family protein